MVPTPLARGGCTRGWSLEVAPTVHSTTLKRPSSQRGAVGCSYGVGAGALVHSRGLPVAVVQVGQSYRWVENVGVEDLLTIAEEVEEEAVGEGQLPYQRPLSGQRFQTMNVVYPGHRTSENTSFHSLQ
jgi:hypothetical protein